MKHSMRGRFERLDDNVAKGNHEFHSHIFLNGKKTGIDFVPI